ncbi:uncharacterized protein [Amphiura filiformis]|uniref:uncharacterized protein n=1 Tax=Amphiura filiformis TaxID=82378 RepID=UPI003B218DE4
MDDESSSRVSKEPVWSSWSSWSTCSQSCGGGTRTRSRHCPVSGACRGSSSDSPDDCNTQECPVWSSWNSWSMCSQSCGGGTRTRIRSCPVSGACRGSSSDSSDCNTQQCPVWSSWSSWSTCSQSCGGGTRTRIRSCPVSDACRGSSSDSPDDCNTQECPITWPMGTYGLLKPITGCPNQWAATGLLHQDTNNYVGGGHYNSRSSPHHVSGPYSKNNMVLPFCIKRVDIADSDDRSWPAGQYCIFRKGGSCPAGMTGGSVLWDDEDDENKNRNRGVLPDGIYSINTRIQFCCQTSGHTSNPIYLPTDKNFFLFKYTYKCQQVHGMRATSEYFFWDTENTGNDDEATGHHPYEGVVYDGIRLEFCYYEPI